MKQKTKRIRWLLAIAVLVALASTAYQRLCLARPIGQGPAGPNVDSSAFASTWSEQKILLLGLGDSVTAGFGAKNAEHSYFNRLHKNPHDEFGDMQGKCLSAVFPNLQTLNLALSGSSSMQHWERIQEQLAVQPEDTFGIVLMTTGGNDLIHWYGRRPPTECAMYGATLPEAEPWIANFAKRLDQMLDHIEACFPGGCEIYLANIYDPTDGVGDAPSIFLPDWPDGLRIHAEYNRIIHDACEHRTGVYEVDLHGQFLGHGSHCRQFWRASYDATDPHYWFYDNIEDPNDRGYDAIRRVFLNTIIQHSTLR